MPQSKPSRLPQIDGLRAFAAITVLLFHYSTRFDQIFVHSSGAPFSFVLGSRGVELFFVISGFVIFMTLDATKHAAEFAVARLGRLFPTFWAAALLTTLVAALASGLAPGLLLDPYSLLANLTMVQGLFGFASVDGVYWSLEIELLYYIWMLLFACMGWLRRVELVLVTWLAVCLADAALVATGKDIVPYTIRHLTLLQWIPWFALGMVVYRVYRDGQARGWQALVVTLALVTIALRTGISDILFATTWIALVSLAAFGRLPIAGWRVMTFFGAISYPLYLLHQQIGYVVILWLQGSGATPLLSMAVAAIIVVLLAWALHRLVEKPSMKLVSRWRARRKAAASVLAENTEKLLRPNQSISSWPWAFACLVIIGSLAVGSIVLNRAKRAENRDSERALLATVNAFDPGKLQSAPCDDPNASTAAPVFLVLGQSNAASQASAPEPGESVRLIVNGQCFESPDPLPGTSGDQASIWTALDKQWASLESGSRPWFSVLAVGATTMAEWTENSLLRETFLTKISELATHNTQPTAILWQQGEADMRLGTAANDWLSGLQRLRTDLDAVGFHAPLMIARSTYCRMTGSGAIGRGLDRLVDAGQLPERVIIGADTDSLPASYRRDDCHFNAKGRAAAAGLWIEALQPILNNKPDN